MRFRRRREPSSGTITATNQPTESRGWGLGVRRDLGGPVKSGHPHQTSNGAVIFGGPPGRTRLGARRDERLCTPLVVDGRPHWRPFRPGATRTASTQLATPFAVVGITEQHSWATFVSRDSKPAGLDDYGTERYSVEPFIGTVAHVTRLPSLAFRLADRAMRRVRTSRTNPKVVVRPNRNGPNAAHQ